jgi:ASCH domain-containing protein
MLNEYHKNNNEMTLKCLSLNQPFAELVIDGRKTIETRTWNTNFRGVFLIHSSKAIDKESAKKLNIDCRRLTTGALVGSAFLYDAKKYSNKGEYVADQSKHLNDNFSQPKYGFFLKDARKLDKPIPLVGKLGFFNVNLHHNYP